VQWTTGREGKLVALALMGGNHMFPGLFLGFFLKKRAGEGCLVIRLEHICMCLGR